MNWKERLGKLWSAARRVVPSRLRSTGGLAREELAIAYTSRRAKITGEAPAKKDRRWLEKFYYFEPLLFAGVNYYVHQVVGPGFVIEGRDERSVRLVKDFVERVDLQALLEGVQLDLGIFGNCLSPDTLVVTNSGFKPISQIEVGTKVLTLDGSFKTVTNKAVRHFEGELLEIVPCGFSAYPLRVTGNHYLPVISREKARSYRNRRSLSKQRSRQYLTGPIYEESEIEWKPASRLVKGDLLFYPISRDISSPKWIKFYDWTKRATSNSRHKSLDNLDKIPLNEDFLRLAGLYLAEGSAPERGCQMSFALNIKEIELENTIREAIKKLFSPEIKVSTCLYPKSHVRTVVVNSRVVKEFFASNFGRRASEKRLPSYILNLPTSKQRILFDFYLRGDGHFIKDKNRWRVETKSETLALQLRTICFRLGVKPCLYKSRGMFILDFGLNTVFDSGFLDKRFCLSPIRKIRKIPYKGPVFDLSVEGNHTFTTATCVVHNSFLEKIRDREGKLVGLGRIDAKSMSYILDKEGKVLVDSLGLPIGYIQEVSTYYDEESFKKIVSKRGVDPSDADYTGGVPFDRDEIVHFKLYTLSDTQMGVGLVEPLFDVARLKMEAEEALGRGIQRAGQPLIVAHIGAPEGPPEATDTSPEKIKAFNETIMKNLDELKNITLPYYYDIEYKEPKELDQLREYLDYFSSLIASGLGLPQSVLLSGRGVASKPAQLQADSVRSTIKAFQRNIARTVEKDIFRPLVQEAGLEEVPKLRFKSTSPSELNSTVERLTAMARAGLITPDKKLEEWYRSIEGVPEIGLEDEESSRRREVYRRKKWSDSKRAIREIDKSLKE